MALYTVPSLKNLVFVLGAIHVCSSTNDSSIDGYFMDANPSPFLRGEFPPWDLRPCFICWHLHVQIQEHLSANWNAIL